MLILKKQQNSVTRHLRLQRKCLVTELFLCKFVCKNVAQPYFFENETRIKFIGKRKHLFGINLFVN